MIFLKKNFLMLYSINFINIQLISKFNCLIAFTSWDNGQCVHCSCLLTRLWNINLEVNLIFLIRSFSTQPKSRDKNLNVLRTKITFKVKWKAFFFSFTGLSLAKSCLRPESLSLMKKTSVTKSKFICIFLKVRAHTNIKTEWAKYGLYIQQFNHSPRSKQSMYLTIINPLKTLLPLSNLVFKTSNMTLE